MKAERNAIYIGSLTDPLYYFDNESIELGTAKTVQAVALVGQELAWDSFSAIVRDNTGDTLDVRLFRSSDGQPIECAGGTLYAIDVGNGSGPSPIVNTPEGTPVWYYHGDELMFKGYLESVKRLGRTRYQLNCVSAIGRLDRMQHGGGLYVKTTVKDVIDSILRSSAE